MRILDAFLDLLLPRRCVLCRRVLGDDEEMVCEGCMESVPFIHHHEFLSNEVAKLLWRRAPIERTTCVMRYIPDTHSSRLILAPKYEGREDVAEWLGQLMFRQLADTGFFLGIDTVVPVPSPPEKSRERGFDRIETMARALVSEMRQAGYDVRMEAEVVLRPKDDVSQTALSGLQRVEHIKAEDFEVVHPERLAGNLLLVDDVITTGATIVAFANAISMAARPASIHVLGASRTAR